MLSHIRVQNISLIDETEIDLDEGLNVLTGETGAGKSILLGAVSLALGQRTAKDAVRDKSKPAEVVLLFEESRPAIVQTLEDMGLPCEEGQILISRRFTSSGRSLMLVNGSQVTAFQVRQIASLLIDIHGQHDHESLLNESRHIDLLDRFIPGMGPLLTQCRASCEKVQSLRENLEKYTSDSHDRERLLSLMAYELKEIELSAWQEGEEEALLDERKKLTYAERLQEESLKAYNALAEDTESSACASTQIGEALSTLENVAAYDEAFFGPFLDELRNAGSLVDDAASSLRRYANDLQSDPQRLAQIEERYDTIQTLKNKYGQTPAQVEAYAEKTRVQKERLENIDQTLADLKQQLSAEEKDLKTICEQMSAMRREAATHLEKDITQVLSTLEFEDPLFQIQIEPKEPGPKGQDKVSFRIRTNVGEPVKPLSQIASGGELSRIMLAIKTVLARQDDIPTLIFDEIDTGISGRTAQSVAEKMSLIARYHQVIVVTHLPQIAAMADVHLRVEKSSESGRAVTDVRRLDEKEMVEELSRMLGGARITDAVRQNAAEMKMLAMNWKKEPKDA